MEQTIPHYSNVDFTGVESPYFLVGLLTAFDNRFQAAADRRIGVISWKQFFAIICINLCREPPTLRELSQIMGSSHQNVKQILLKLHKKGFLEFQEDSADKRKQRIFLTNQCRQFCMQNDSASAEFMSDLFRNIDPKQLKTVIDVLLKIEDNLKTL